MRTVLLASSQSSHSVDAIAWCKRTLSVTSPCVAYYDVMASCHALWACVIQYKLSKILGARRYAPHQPHHPPPPSSLTSPPPWLPSFPNLPVGTTNHLATCSHGRSGTHTHTLAHTYVWRLLTRYERFGGVVELGHGLTVERRSVEQQRMLNVLQQRYVS